MTADEFITALQHYLETVQAIIAGVQNPDDPEVQRQVASLLMEETMDLSLLVNDRWPTPQARDAVLPKLRKRYGLEG